MGCWSSARRRPACRSPTRSSARAARSRWPWASTCGGPACTGVGTSTGGWRRPACSTSATTRWTTSCERAACRRCSSAGSPERATFDLNALTGIGVKLVGRLAGIRDGRAQFSGSLRNKCELADLKLDRLLDTIDEWATANGMDDATPPPHRFAPTVVPEPPTLGLDLTSGAIQTIIWATGFRPDYSWLDVDGPRRQGHGPARRRCRRLAGDVPDRHCRSCVDASRASSTAPATTRRTSSSSWRASSTVKPRRRRVDGHARLAQGVLVGAAAAGGSSMDARRLVSGVEGTVIRPRVGRSRSKVTRSMRVTSSEAISTPTMPLLLSPR